MASPAASLGLTAIEKTERSVWVVVDPRDLVTGQRVLGPLRVRLKDGTSRPIAARSGVYCFVDLGLPAGNQTIQVEPLGADRRRYFAAEKAFALETIPVPGNPLRRNRVVVDLLPRPAYAFDGQATLATGTLVRASDNSSPIDGAAIALLPDGEPPLLFRGRTDERGAFVIFFPPTAPESPGNAGLKDLKFKLRFEVGGGVPDHVTNEFTVKEGSTKAVGRIAFPGT